MSKTNVLWKASYLQMRVYMWWVIGIVAASFVSNFIVYLSTGYQEDNTQVSIGNMLVIFMIFLAIVLPTAFFRKMLNFGATRKTYYIGLTTIYTAWAAAFALFNVLWLELEKGLIREYMNTFNILEIFHWDQFGVVGMFLYQFGTYMLLASLLNLLFSDLRLPAGWVLWVLLAAAIPVGTSVPSLRIHVADVFETLLFNDSLLAGFGLTLGLSILFLSGGWLLTRHRTF